MPENIPAAASCIAGAANTIINIPAPGAMCIPNGDNGESYRGRRGSRCVRADRADSEMVRIVQYGDTKDTERTGLTEEHEKEKPSQWLKVPPSEVS